MTTRTAVGPLRRSLAGARAVGAALTYTTTGDTTVAKRIAGTVVRSRKSRRLGFLFGPSRGFG